jgi:dienelactone hydrolase
MIGFQGSRFRLLILGLLLIAFFAGYAWGAATQKYQVFPYDLIHSARVSLMRPSENKKAALINEISAEGLTQSRAYAEERYKYLSQNAVAERKKLRNRIIAPDEIIRFSKLKGQKAAAFKKEKSVNKDAAIYLAELYGVKAYGVHRKSATPKNCLAIYNQGHGGNPSDFPYFHELSERFIAQGCDVLSLSMLGLGYNEGPLSYPASFNQESTTFTLALSAEQAERHTNYKYFFDPANPKLDPLVLFLSGNDYLIRKLSAPYKTVIMLGISGGGWLTTMLSALNENIDASFSFAGSLPEVFRINKSNVGDWEQTNAPMWRGYDYWDFYFLSLFDQKNNRTRTHHLIYNNNDPCCFMDPSASVFKRMVDSLSIPGLSVDIVSNDKHEIIPDEAWFLIGPSLEGNSAAGVRAHN